MRNPLWRFSTAFVLSLAALHGTAVAQPTGDAGAGQATREARLSFANYAPPGWSAGRVSFGVGDTRPNASQRVREVQRRLRGLGYDAGPIDGIFGARTEAAVRRYQRRTGLERSGVVDAGTLYVVRNRNADLRDVRVVARDSHRSAHLATERKARVGRGGEDVANAPTRADASERSAGAITQRGDSRPARRSSPRPEHGSPQRSDVSQDGDRTSQIAIGVLLLALAIGAAVVVARRRRVRGLARVPRSQSGGRGGMFRRNRTADSQGELSSLPMRQNVFLQGVSTDSAIGSFAGFALASVSSGDGDGVQVLYLLDDPSKPRPVWVRRNDVHNGPLAPVPPGHGPSVLRLATDSRPATDPSAQEASSAGPPSRRLKERSGPPWTSNGPRRRIRRGVGSPDAHRNGGGRGS